MPRSWLPVARTLKKSHVPATHSGSFAGCKRVGGGDHSHARCSNVCVWGGVPDKLAHHGAGEAAKISYPMPCVAGSPAAACNTTTTGSPPVAVVPGKSMPPYAILGRSCLVGGLDMVGTGPATSGLSAQVVKRTLILLIAYITSAASGRRRGASGSIMHRHDKQQAGLKPAAWP
jgi:hypothetical protein